MKFGSKEAFALLTAAALAASLCGCGGKGPDTMAISGENVTVGDLALRPEGKAGILKENGGLKLMIPLDYVDLVNVDTSRSDVLFSVSEKASVEAAKGDEVQGAGWLFSIGAVNEAELRRMLCGEMLNSRVFASDGKGTYYMYYGPTDVRYVRENDEGMGDENNEDWKQWMALCQWAENDVRDSILAENPGLTPEKRGNSDVEQHLYRAAYMEETRYALSATEYGTLEPKALDPAPYVESLTTGITYDYADEAAAPEGPYVTLSFPDEGTKLDFFTGEGGVSYVRSTWQDIVTLYKAAREDGGSDAGTLMREWYEALAKDNGLG